MKTSMIISGIDIISCAFGGAVLLFLIASTTTQKREVKKQRSSDSLIVQASAVSNKTTDKPLVVLEWQPPGQDQWQSIFADAQKKNFSSISSGTSFTIIPRPKKGIWLFRAYYKDYPPEGPEQIIVKIQSYGKYKDRIDAGLSAVLSNPGDQTEKVQIIIE